MDYQRAQFPTFLGDAIQQTFVPTSRSDRQQPDPADAETPRAVGDRNDRRDQAHDECRQEHGAQRHHPSRLRGVGPEGVRPVQREDRQERDGDAGKELRLRPLKDVHPAPGQKILAREERKYLETYEMTKPGKDGEKDSIPITMIRQRADGMQLSIRSISPVVATPNRQKGYEELSTTVIFEPTDLERLSTFLFNLESSGPKLRILDVRWDLRPDKENPYVPGKDPGYLIGAPTVKIGLRKPLTKESSR